MDQIQDYSAYLEIIIFQIPYGKNLQLLGASEVLTFSYKYYILK